MRGRLQIFSSLLKDLLIVSKKKSNSHAVRKIQRPENFWDREEEKFELDLRPGHTILMGRFQVHGQVILTSHSQWDEDSYQLSLQQRKEILRKTIEERLKKAGLLFSEAN